MQPVLQLLGKSVQDFLIDRKAQKTPFFFGGDQSCFGQNFDMVRDGGLRERTDFLNFVADQILAFADAAQNMQAPFICQGFGYFFNLSLA